MPDSERMTTQPVTPAGGWIPDDATLGARLALIRQRQGWGNVAEAALACGLPVASWRNWERDGRHPRDLSAVVGAIAAATGCDPMWLAGIAAYPGRRAPVRQRTESAASLVTEQYRAFLVA
jgi:hypothetical protein